jgi:hypothetical protein
MNETVLMPASTGSVDVSGACFETVISDLAKSTTDRSALSTQRKAVSVVLNAIRSYQKAFGSGDVGKQGTGRVSQPWKSGSVAEGTNGLLYGRVQSGKTNASIATVALASGNGFKCFVVLTSDNTWLGKQTVDRFRLQLGAGDGPIVRSWEDWRADPSGFAESIRGYLDDTGIVLVSTKNPKNLENLAVVLKELGASRVPGLILDDEADNASLNTNAARMAKKKTIEPSAIFALIGEIRSRMPNHVYIQITATPQSLLLQAVENPLRPAWVVMIEPGDGYVGGEKFFEEESKYIVHVNGEEIGDLRTGKINPGGALEMPKDFARAVTLFAVATAIRQIQEGNGEVLSMLIHIDHKKVSHKAVQNVLTQYVMWLDKALRSKLSERDRKDAELRIRKAHEELSKTNESLPDVEAVIERLRSNLRNAQPQIIDADNPNQNPQYRPGMNFLIGGNRLGRGVTIEGLIVTYYARDAKTKMMDTVHQHARMFGYRNRLLSITRLFSPQHIMGALKDIYESDEGTRQVLERDGKLSVKPVWLGPALRPTRANVLNPADIRAVVGGRAIWPSRIVHSPAKLKTLLPSLEELLSPFTDPHEYYERPLEFLRKILGLIPAERVPTRSWSDDRIQQLIHSMQVKPLEIESCLINVRRGARGSEGFQISESAQHASGFAEGTQINEAKAKYADRPVLLLRKQAGLREKGWSNHPFYAPTLILPKVKYAFVFIDA